MYLLHFYAKLLLTIDDPEEKKCCENSPQHQILKLIFPIFCSTFFLVVEDFFHNNTHQVDKKLYFDRRISSSNKFPFPLFSSPPLYKNYIECI